MDHSAFIQKIWAEGKARYRDLPWRHIDDPYAVLVSEVMLQQTQVKRVLNYWPRWMAKFPTIDALASASNSDVLEEWQGLGYNRRALALKRCAEECATKYAGQLPATSEELQRLPGIGPATAAGVMAFARNQRAMYLETNVRSVFINEFFAGADQVSDKELIPLVEATCPEDNPCDWYYALLDYGAFLKGQGVNPSRKSKHYTKQSKFEGSHRQKRANLLRVVLDDPGISYSDAFVRLNTVERESGRPEIEERVFEMLVCEMVSEGFFSRSGDVLDA